MSANRTRKGGQSVLLVVMPFYSLKAPALGVSLLKARLQEEGIPCAVRYFNIAFANRIGLELHEHICALKGDGGESFNGEWLFARDCFGSRLPGEDAYVDYLHEAGTAGAELPLLLGLRRGIGTFLDACLAEVVRQECDIIGFSTLFDQNLASIALAQRIKLRAPEKRIVFGGANCDGVMGLELHRRFSCIDFICSGEADHSFPRLVRTLTTGQEPTGIPGVIRRAQGRSVIDHPPAPTNDLDALPFPDFSDYFLQMGPLALAPDICQSGLPMETSRGCWWGARSKCAFCGLNNDILPFRSKSPQRVESEIDHLETTYLRRHGRERISMSDNILDLRYFDHLLPRLAQRKPPARLFFETKANLSGEQVRRLAEAGIQYIQPGIESLSTPVLQMIAKGVGALQNLQLLKNCGASGVYPVWNLLYDFPGEPSDTGRQLLETIARIPHLTPPGGCSRFELQRFSPYFNRPEDYGLANIRPKPSYRFIYPFDEEALCNLAYHFDCDVPRASKASAYGPNLKAAVTSWQQAFAQGAALEQHPPTARSVLLHDSRPRAAQGWIELTGLHSDVYLFCEQIRSFSDIMADLEKRYSHRPLRRRDVREILEELIARHLMAREGDRYLSLAIPFGKNSAHSA